MRRRVAVKRAVMPDARYGDVLVARFINYVMLEGKKAIAEKAVYSALADVGDKLKRDPVELFTELVERITPKIEVRPRRIGGATYQIPVEVYDRRGTALALKWLTYAIRKQSGKTLSEKILKSLMEIQNSTGWAFKKKEEVFRMAEANKAFAFYSW
ncbi:MAG: 30S ribosomal protein S7 [Rickettsiales bacterium]|jgi:small subunit ribosomal protein S7|nr:30S ribosomal protein S7 [Rickettsiales bacterium]